MTTTMIYEFLADLVLSASGGAGVYRFCQEYLDKVDFGLSRGIAHTPAFQKQLKSIHTAAAKRLVALADRHGIPLSLEEGRALFSIYLEAVEKGKDAAQVYTECEIIETLALDDVSGVDYKVIAEFEERIRREYGADVQFRTISSTQHQIIISAFKGADIIYRSFTEIDDYIIVRGISDDVDYVYIGEGRVRLETGEIYSVHITEHGELYIEE